MADGSTSCPKCRPQRECIDAQKELLYWREHRHEPPLDEIALSDDLFVAGVKFAYDGYLLFGRLDEDDAMHALERRHARGPLRRRCSWFAIEHICRAVWTRMGEPDETGLRVEPVVARRRRRSQRSARHACQEVTV